MADINLYFATNRRHQGDDQWRPTHYGADFSSSGQQNLRFGKVQWAADDATVNGFLNQADDSGTGQGEALSGYLAEQAKAAMEVAEKIEDMAEPEVTDAMRAASSTTTAFRETLDQDRPEGGQGRVGAGAGTGADSGADTGDGAAPRLGSQQAFDDLQREMAAGTDVVVYIHGFKVAWHKAVGAAAALEIMLNRDRGVADTKSVKVILFSWPSDGIAVPLYSYYSDRADAEGSGYSFGRALLRLRDFLAQLRTRDDTGRALCAGRLHLLCHSMGNYVLQNAVARMVEFNHGLTLPRVFTHIFMCAADVDEDVLSPGASLGRLHELAASITVYSNTGDLAMYVSDYTKGQPDRLGHGGPAQMGLLNRKIQHVDCSPVVTGFVEHSYYLVGYVNDDIRHSVDAVDHDAGLRRRTPVANQTNSWRMR